MALETLTGITKIGGFEAKEVTWAEPENNFIEINHPQNILTFKLQEGPIKAYGVNGCQVDTIIEAAKLILEGLNENFPCKENACAITKLEEALMQLDKRKKDREKRGVEGTNVA